MEIKYNLFKMEKFSETIYKMDKWAYEECQNDFYEIVDDESMSHPEKVKAMEEFLEVLVQDWERLEYYMQDEDGNVPPYTQEELAETLVNQYA
jgi:hypothetical protein